MWKEIINSELLQSLEKAELRLPTLHIIQDISKSKCNQWLCKENTYALITDNNCWQALASEIVAALSSHVSCKTIILPDTPKPDEHTLAYIHSQLEGITSIIAVGSGTINDLCKLTSYQANIPYMVFPTAPSMNGYTSKNASILNDKGYRESHAAHLPEVIICHMPTLENAPVRLLQAGIGDSLARTTAQADWLISHHIQGTYYDTLPFALADVAEAKLFACVTDAHVLMQLLLLSGLGMSYAGGSYPASQAEHMIAHTMEMHYGAALPHHYHGEEIGVTTLTMSRLQWWALKHGLVDENIRPILTSVMMPTSELEAVLHNIEAPVTPQTLGWPLDDYIKAVQYARHTRDRFTFLNIIDNHTIADILYASYGQQQ